MLLLNQASDRSDRMAMPVTVAMMGMFPHQVDITKSTRREMPGILSQK
jgi:hypothetical protein